VSKIGLIDYGMGNIHSVKKAIENVGGDVLLINKKSHINNCSALIVPGQGAFDPAMSNLQQTDLIFNIKDWISRGNPFLGICLGLQILLEGSEEGNNMGLGIIKGHVKKIPNVVNQRIPHIGWCNLIPLKENTLLNKNEFNNWVYFDHSYYADPLDSEIIAAKIQYGYVDLTAIIEIDNLIACQFHPEKSGLLGETLLERWLKKI